MNKWQQWYDGLSLNTIAYLKTQAIWTDKDLAKFAMIAFVVGVIIGVIV